MEQLVESITAVPVEIRGFYLRVRGLADDISYKKGYRLAVEVDKTYGTRVYLQVQYYREDCITGRMGWGSGGKMYLSPYMTDSEIVQGAFGLFKNYEEHECREFFAFKGKRVYGPHISVEALMEVADRTTYR